MPSIGKPGQGRPNQFSKIKMAQKQSSTLGKSAKPESVGDELNRLTGLKTSSKKFVDQKKHNQMGKDGFLKLLTHQLKNQDPFKPQDQKQFASELAQFSQLEQLSNVNNKLENLNRNGPGQSKFHGASFLGKEIITNGTSVKVSEAGEKIDLPFHLAKPAAKAIVRVYDNKNQLIKQMNLDTRGAGQQSVTWNGSQEDGFEAAKGIYRFEVRAWDENFNEFKAETKARGLVTSVSFENGETILEVDGKKKVFLRDVDSFKLPQEHKSPVSHEQLQKTANDAYNKNQEVLN